MRTARLVVLLATAVMILPVADHPEAMQFGKPIRKLLLRLQPAGPTVGTFAKTTQTGDLEIWVDNRGQTILQFALFGLTPRGVHSVFLDLDPTQPPLAGVAPDCTATDAQTGTQADVYCWTPAAADTAAFTSGNGLDPHGFVADDRGNALIGLRLNYDVTESRTAPLVLRPGVTQTVRVAPSAGLCAGTTGGSFVSRLDSAFMRAFDITTAARHPAQSPSFPLTDSSHRTRMVRGTVRGIFVLEHLDGVTHGRVLGQGVAGPGDGPCGDHVRRLRGELSQATTAGR
jgi:hypothetical protein